MNIEYELTKQDYMDFNFHYMEHSATIKRSFFMQRIFGPIIFLVAIILMIFVMFSDKFYISDMIYELLWVYVSLCILTSIIWIAFYPRIIKKFMERRISKMMDEDKNVVYPEKHLFIYVTALSAFPIPLSVFSTNE